MDIELAIQIANVADAIADFRDPSSAVSDRIAEVMFDQQEKRETMLDELCHRALRQMVITEARKTLAEAP